MLLIDPPEAVQLTRTEYENPKIVLPIAEGVAVVGRRFGRAAMLALVAFLLVGPTFDALDHVLARSRYRVFDSHGDQRNDLLDALGR